MAVFRRENPPVPKAQPPAYLVSVAKGQLSPSNLVEMVVAEGSFLPIHDAGRVGRGHFSVFSSDFDGFWRKFSP